MKCQCEFRLMSKQSTFTIVLQSQLDVQISCYLDSYGSYHSKSDSVITRSKIYALLCHLHVEIWIAITPGNTVIFFFFFGIDYSSWKYIEYSKNIHQLCRKSLECVHYFITPLKYLLYQVVHTSTSDPPVVLFELDLSASRSN